MCATCSVKIPLFRHVNVRAKTETSSAKDRVKIDAGWLKLPWYYLDMKLVVEDPEGAIGGVLEGVRHE